MQAFGISEEDVENVLRQHSVRILNSDGRSFEDMADRLFGNIDELSVERAALKGGVEMEEQTAAAYAEIARQLVDLGVLKAPAAEPPLEDRLNDKLSQTAGALLSMQLPRRSKP